MRSTTLVFPAAAALVSVAGAPLPAHADELWRQDHVDCATVSNGCWGGISSQDARNPGGSGWMYEVADNFDAAAGWTVTNLEFWGAQATTTPYPTTGFMIRFYADNNGQIGPLLLTQDVFTFAQDVYFTWNVIPFQGFHYTLNLSTPFAVPAAGRYWMSVVAIQPYGAGNPDYRQWGWNLAQNIRGPVCQQSSSPPGGYSPQSNDVAFVLYGTGGTPPCYANCDSSTAQPRLNVADFTCFLQRFAEGSALPAAQQYSHYCNCDGGNVPPPLNVADFTCFLQKFAAGCP
jgi:hypothetical protein